MKQKLYNITVCILCIVSVTFAILNFTKGLTTIQTWIDNIIYFLFIIDYIIRFMIADKKKEFFQQNILDLIAIIPFSSAFRIFRILKFTKLLRFSKFIKLIKIGSLTARMLAKVRRFLNTNGFKYVLMLSCASILAGTFGMMYFEQMAFQDALWWSFVTATTVGYGDLSPETNAGRIIA
ncbi:MAG: ion transporter, partial [Clostridia bacterium]